MPRFSIVIPCFNGRLTLDAAIQSCLGQTVRDLEVIVVDDGSTDGSHEVAQAAASVDPRVMVLRQDNEGVGAARNAGLAVARGEYVNFLDADDLFEPAKLEVQGAVLDENPDLGCVFCDGQAIDADGRVVMERLVDARKLAGPMPLFDLFFSGGQFPPLIPLLRRSVVLAAGGFEHNRRAAGWADTGLWLRLGLADVRYHFVGRVLCRYRITADNMSSDARAMEQAADVVYTALLREHPAASARALRRLHGRLNDNEAALAALRDCVAGAREELRTTRNEWRITRETLHADRQALTRALRDVRDAEDRLSRLSSASRPSRRIVWSRGRGQRLPPGNVEAACSESSFATRGTPGADCGNVWRRGPRSTS
jgi:glycosyltransferase involved in cell wall biosynthesis